MPTTYEPIATTTLSSSNQQIEFTNITSAYTDLLMIVTPKTTSGTAQVCFLINGDSGSNYSFTRIGATGTGTQGIDHPNPVAFGQLSWYGYMGPSEGQSIQAHFMNYTSTNMFKTIMTRNSNPAYGIGANINTWKNNSAITAIRIYSDTEPFASGTRATLYGIKAA